MLGPGSPGACAEGALLSCQAVHVCCWTCTAEQMQQCPTNGLLLETSTSAAASRLARPRKLPLSAFLVFRDEFQGLTELVEQATR